MSEAALKKQLVVLCLVTVAAYGAAFLIVVYCFSLKQKPDILVPAFFVVMVLSFGWPWRGLVVAAPPLLRETRNVLLAAAVALFFAFGAVGAADGLLNPWLVHEMLTLTPSANLPSWLPPETFQQPSEYTIRTVPLGDIYEMCGRRAAAGCAFNDTVIMPNPCDYADQAYAALLCHEQGHVNGWRHK